MWLAVVQYTTNLHSCPSIPPQLASFAICPLLADIEIEKLRAGRLLCDASDSEPCLELMLDSDATAGMQIDHGALDRYR
ncbi:hypothetical protein RRF57_006792 [Xylaria bambusicola]|uniref:Uncharacterized protein n=1 Tax=Xylaria bambusicola TaxID=326684 RepID=A0AAN7ULS1_9PEZI